jgi:hypothetical protein
VEGVASDRATFVTSVLPETGAGSMPSTEITSYKPTLLIAVSRYQITSVWSKPDSPVVLDTGLQTGCNVKFPRTLE